MDKFWQGVVAGVAAGVISMTILSVLPLGVANKKLLQDKKDLEATVVHLLQDEIAAIKSATAVKPTPPVTTPPDVPTHEEIRDSIERALQDGRRETGNSDHD